MKAKTVTQGLVRGLVQGLCAFLFLFCFQQIKAVDYEVVSPNGELKIKLHINGSTQYEILQGETSLIGVSTIALNLHSGLVVGAGTVKSTETNSVNTTLPVLIGKNKTLDEKYNERIIHFNENYDLIIRAYNEGIAYRWKTELTGNIIIDDERLEYNFSGSPTTYFPEADNLEHWEKSYTVNTANRFSASRYAVTPVLFSWPNSSHKIVIAEADLYDYPGLYIQATGNNAMKGMWAKYPETVEEPDNIYSNHKPLTRYNYIATTTGTRTFPWRVFAVSNDDKSLLNNELVYLLAEPQRLTNTDWIVPGKTAWEWWHKAMLDPSVDPNVPAYGNANLGFNLYKYYVDFAAKNNIQYLTLDAGWSESYIKRLCDYARGKGVKIIVWTWASVPLEEAGWVAKQKRNGVSGAKIDFFNRNDQIAMTWGHRIAQELADSEMIGIFHGCPVPTGLNRTFPNILNFEAILGNEENFWRKGCSPDYHVQFPFIRSLAGPEDFTPGSMRNKTKTSFQPVDKDNIVPSSQGTRAHELSMYIVFDQWLGFLCDAPTEYMKYPDILDFLAHVPTVWDKTVPLDAQLGEYIVMAKQTGKEWYVGGMSSWAAHDVTVDFSFLSPGTSWQAAILKDGQNAGNYPTRYAGDTITVTSESRLALNMAQGGGFVIRLTEVEETGETDIK
ncbi:MAG: glycoside hydrolase family 97 protein, partial [Dysgonamonadaceae bacterium]|nr:glycoside hydrolase family 97 protein [Dysgonamonadaceae bacterium]